MFKLVGLLLGLAALSLPSAPPSSVQHETYYRTVTVANPSAPQAYFILPPDVFLKSRADLGDLRLVRGSNEVPYVIKSEDANAGEPVELKSRLLNVGSFRNGARFDVEIMDADRAKSPYNRLHIVLARTAPDFIATVQLSGSEQLGGTSTDLGTRRIFKLASENLPAHTEIELSPSNFRYLHVIVDGALAPQDIKSATVEANAAHSTEWSDIEGGPAIETGRTTTVSFLASNRYPVAAIQFVVDRSQENFDRNVKIFADDTQIANFRLRRTTIKGNSTSLDEEDSRAVFPATAANRYRAEIDNGDDSRLLVSGATLQTVQRRIYFDPKGADKLTLYYGDARITAPTYDYARLNEPDAKAIVATVTQEEQNPDFQPRPDIRPWSEQHPTVLKAALILTVLVLGSIALLSISMKPRDLSK